jgi:hypothetical protein
MLAAMLRPLVLYDLGDGWELGPHFQAEQFIDLLLIRGERNILTSVDQVA